MFIYIELCQCADIDLKLTLPGQAVGKLVIETMNPLQYQNILVSQSHIISVVLLLPQLKIKTGNLHGLSGQKLAHLLIKQLHIHSLQALEVIIAILVLRRHLPFHKIIVHGNGMRSKSCRFKLNGQPVGKCRLSG